MSITAQLALELGVGAGSGCGKVPNPGHCPGRVRAGSGTGLYKEYKGGFQVPFRLLGGGTVRAAIGGGRCSGGPCNLGPDANPDSDLDATLTLTRTLTIDPTLTLP